MDTNDAPPSAAFTSADALAIADAGPPPPSRASWRLRGAAAGASSAAPPSADDAPPEQAKRDGELWRLARRARRTVLRVDLELRTSLARQLFRRDFVFVSRQLHALESSRRVQALDPTVLDDALAALQRRADGVQALLARIADDLRPALARHAPAGAALVSAAPARFQATVVTPLAHRFLALLRQADDTLTLLETAWLLGLVSPSRRTALGSDCRRAFHGFKDLACSRRQAVGEQVRAANARERDGSQDRREGGGLGD